MLSLDPSKKFHFGSHQEFYNKAVLSTVIKLYSNNKVRYSLLIKCFNFQAGCKSLAWWILRTGVLKLLGAREPLQVVFQAPSYYPHADRSLGASWCDAASFPIKPNSRQLSYFLILAVLAFAILAILKYLSVVLINPQSMARGPLGVREPSLKTTVLEE